LGSSPFSITFSSSSFRSFIGIVGYLFAEMVFFGEFFPYDLDDIISMAVGFGEDQGFRNLKNSIIIIPVGNIFGSSP